MSMLTDDEKKAASLAVIIGPPKDGAEDGGETPSSVEPSVEDAEELEIALDAAVDEMMIGFEDRDPEAVKMALRSFVEMIQ